MTWFRVDDKFHGHAKVRALPRSVRAEAIGTWTLAGTYAADHATDGYVPAHVVEDLGGSLEGAEALVAVGLWRRRRDGFVFVNWAEFQPTRAQQEQKRAETRNRVAEHRARRKAAESGEGSADVTRYDDDVQTPRPVPSRPVPLTGLDSMTPPDVSSSQLKRARDSQAGDNRVDEFDLLAVAAALVEVSPGLDLGDEEHLHQRALVAGRHVLAKGGPRVKHPTEYIVRSIRRDVDGWSAFAYRGELP